MKVWVVHYLDDYFQSYEIFDSATKAYNECVDYVNGLGGIGYREDSLKELEESYEIDDESFGVEEIIFVESYSVR